MPRTQRLPTITTALPSPVAEAISSIAKANRISKSEVARELIVQALAQQSEQLTESQFSLTNERLDRIERRFSAFQAKILRATTRGSTLSQYALMALLDDNKQLYDQCLEKAEREAGLSLKKLNEK